MPSGRLLDSVSNGGARGMIVAPKPAPKAGEGGQNSAYGPLRLSFSPVADTLTGRTSLVILYPDPITPLSSPMSSYLVTGGAGFIGSHLSEELLRRGHRVRVVDSLITGKRQNLKHLPAVEFMEGDLADFASCVRAVEGIDYVLHQAAIPSVPRSVKDPITSNRANIDGSINILVAARDAGVKRLVYAGSSSAYGDTPTLPKREDMPTEPVVTVRAAEARG